MNTVFSLILMGIEAVGQLATNPAFGLGNDGARIAGLLGLLAKFGRKGEEAIPELKAFTDEVNAIIASGERVDPEVWDEITSRRHSDLDRIKDAVEGDS